MPSKFGRPGRNRAKSGRIRAAIIPDLLEEVRDLAKTDVRLRSMSHIVETSLLYYLSHYKKAHGRLDQQNFPELPPSRRTKS